MKKYYRLIIWVLLMVLTLFLVFIIPKVYTAQILMVTIFDVIAFVSQLIICFMKSKSSKETFYKYPTMLVSMVYLILQFIISTVVAVVNEAISLKAVLIINFVLLVVMWILILLTLMAKDKIENTNYRQKDHYIE